MIDVEKAYPNLAGCKDVMDVVHAQRRALEKDVQKYCAERDT